VSFSPFPAKRKGPGAGIIRTPPAATDHIAGCRPIPLSPSNDDTGTGNTLPEHMRAIQMVTGSLRYSVTLGKPVAS
jgi:hypothetical protein